MHADLIERDPVAAVFVGGPAFGGQLILEGLAIQQELGVATGGEVNNVRLGGGLVENTLTIQRERTLRGGSVGVLRLELDDGSELPREIGVQHGERRISSRSEERRVGKEC